MSTKTNEELAEIQNLPVTELTEALTGLDAEDLAALKALERSETVQRDDVVAAIDSAIAAIPGADDSKKSSKKTIAAKSTTASAATASAPAWQAADYTGPLDIAQAAWRRANIKPVTGIATK